MRYCLIVTFAAGGMFAWSDAAWAIAQETTVTITESGKPLPGAMVSLTVKSSEPRSVPQRAQARTAPSRVQSRPQPARAEPRTAPRIVQRSRIRTDERSRVTFRYDDATVPPDALVDITVSTPDGRSRTRRDVPLALLVAGGEIDINDDGATPETPLSPSVTGAPPVPFTGPYIGAHVSRTFGSQEIAETIVEPAIEAPSDPPIDAPPDEFAEAPVEEIAVGRPETVTRNRFSRSANGTGAGVSGGINFSLGSNIVGGPFVGLDFPNEANDRAAGSGAFWQAKSDFVVTGGVQLGIVGAVAETPTFFYGLVGASFQRQDVEFADLARTSETQTLTGGTVGVGLAVQPAFLRGLGIPVSLFVQYEHTWWNESDRLRPAIAPETDYVFRRDDDRIKFGVQLFFSPGS